MIYWLVRAMVKLLSDICLGVVQKSLDKNYNAQNLPTMYKEVLLERICNHDQLTEAYTPHVARSLFSESLRRVNFYKCEQITDSILKLLKESRCKLECIIFSKCDNVTGIISYIAISLNWTDLDKSGSLVVCPL